MAFSKKMQDVLPKLVKEIKTQDITDFYDAANILEVLLDESGVGMGIDGAKYIALMLDELEYHNSQWKPNKEDLVFFLKLFPATLKKGITKDVMVNYIPKQEWKHFDKEWANAKSNFKKSLGESPVILSEYYGSQLDCNVFLGDITEALGMSKRDLDKDYEAAYTAIDETIGHNAVMAALKSKLPNSKVKIIDYPNGSNLKDAKYEFIIESKLGRKTIERKITAALRVVGLG